jgi:hypothetical protein
MGRNNSGRLVSTNASGSKKPSPERGNSARLARYRAMPLKADIVPILCRNARYLEGHSRIAAAVQLRLGGNYVVSMLYVCNGIHEEPLVWFII